MIQTSYAKYEKGDMQHIPTQKLSNFYLMTNEKLNVLLVL